LVAVDSELVGRAVAGSAAAFGELVGRHERSLRAVAYYIVRDAHLAEDVVQDSFVSAYRQLATLKDRKSFSRWMAQIVRRQALAVAGRKVRMVPLNADTEDVVADDSLDLDSRQLLEAVMSLSDEEQRVLMLRHFDGHEMAAIAQITGEPVGTITKRLSRAHAHLRERLKEYPS
jgi:RNA polymerase sigma-70 factor, ECF subfamily